MKVARLVTIAPLLMSLLLVKGAWQEVAHAATGTVYVVPHEAEGHRCRNGGRVVAYQAGSLNEWYGEVRLCGREGHLYGEYHVAHRHAPYHGSSITWRETFSADGKNYTSSQHASGYDYTASGTERHDHPTCASQSLTLQASDREATSISTDMTCLSHHAY